MAELSLSNDEDDELILDANTLAQQSGFSELCLVGRFLTDRNINFMAMKHRMAGLWRPGKGVAIHDLGGQRFLFQFFHVIDMKRVFEGGPWSFDSLLLILHHLKQGELPNQVPLNSIAFWIQVHDLPVGYMSHHVGKQLGDFIGQFLEYDTTNNTGVWRAYMRVRVAIDVGKPLKRCKKIRKSEGEWFLVNFKYERLGSFCFICGCLGHTERFCELLFSIPEEEVKRGWGTWLRAPDKRNANLGGSKWLRDDGHNDGGSISGIATNDRRDGEGIMAGENFKITANPVFSGKITAGLGPLNTKQILHDSRKVMADSSLLIDTPINEESMDEDYGLDLIDDRKRRRAAQLPESHSTHLKLDSGKTNHPVSAKHADPEQVFLLAGPGGLQACQES